MIQALAELALRQARAWSISKLAGHSTVMINVDVYGTLKTRGPSLMRGVDFHPPVGVRPEEPAKYVFGTITADGGTFENCYLIADEETATLLIPHG